MLSMVEVLVHRRQDMCPLYSSEESEKEIWRLVGWATGDPLVTEG